MKKLLHIKSSILNNNSISNEYGEKLIKHLKEKEDYEILERDVANNPVSKLDANSLAERINKNGDIFDEHLKLINEVKNSDILVISMPMYNFSIPIQLHAYFDALALVGETFHYENDGTQIGHLKDKEVYLVISRGGIYSKAGLTFQEDYVKTFLGFLGVTKVNTIFVEGYAVHKDKNILDISFND